MPKPLPIGVRHFWPLFYLTILLLIFNFYMVSFGFNITKFSVHGTIWWKFLLPQWGILISNTYFESALEISFITEQGSNFWNLFLLWRSLCARIFTTKAKAFNFMFAIKPQKCPSKTSIIKGSNRCFKNSHLNHLTVKILAINVWFFTPF